MCTVHACMVTFTASDSCRGLLYKVHNARHIIVPHHVHQSFTHSRGTGVNGPAKQLAGEEERDKNKDAKVLKGRQAVSGEPDQ